MNVDDIKTVAMIGAGDMGHGIAEVALIAGFKVNLYDVKQEFVDKGERRIMESLDKLASKGRVPADHVEKIKSSLLKTTTDLAEAVKDADLAIEAAPEVLDLKKKIFSEMDKAAPANTLLASNTSTMSITEIAKSTGRPEKVFGMHYFNPAVIMKLVEVIHGDQTSDETIEIGRAYVEKIGKVPVIVRKDVPGFIANRIQAAVWREILWLVADGVATPQDVDRVVKTSIGRRWAAAGPFEVTELAGLDLKQEILKELLPSLASGAEVPPILREKVARGELGTKAGKGFYEWTAEGARDLRERIARALVEIERWE